MKAADRFLVALAALTVFGVIAYVVLTLARMYL